MEEESICLSLSALPLIFVAKTDCHSFSQWFGMNRVDGKVVSMALMIANGAPLDSSCYNTRIGDEDGISCSSFQEFRMKRSRANATDDTDYINRRIPSELLPKNWTGGISGF